jgi:hypothetical protein
VREGIFEGIDANAKRCRSRTYVHKGFVVGGVGPRFDRRMHVSPRRTSYTAPGMLTSMLSEPSFWILRNAYVPVVFVMVVSFQLEHV